MRGPAFVDLQVNGYAGVDFNDSAITPEMIAHAVRAARADGTERFLATVITATADHMSACLGNLVRAREEDDVARETIVGLHVEGPFISGEPGYVGAHPAESVADADRDLAERLLDAGEGLVKLFTLAPERDRAGTITRFLADRGVWVAAGHTNASVSELRSCLDSGMTLFTHLGNGCPMQMHRHDNIIWRALGLHDRFEFGLIADGVHLPRTMLRAIVDLAGTDRCFVVTDAMSAAGLGPGRYELGGQAVEVGADRAVWAADRSHFVGSASTMSQCAEVLGESGFTDREVQTLTVRNPARIIGIDVGERVESTGAV